MADTAPGYLTTPRGVVNKYLYQREDLGNTDPDKVQNREVTGLEGSDSLQGIGQATLTTLDDAYGKTAGGLVLNYNPITDNYDIKPGLYIL